MKNNKKPEKRLISRISFSNLVILTSIVCVLPFSGCRSSMNKFERADALYNAGVAYLSKGDYEKAIESLKNARNLDPKSARIYNALGLVYHSYGMFDKAIECYLESLALKSNAPDVNNNLAASYLQVGEYEKAIKQCEIALSNKAYLSPSASYFNMAQAYKAVGNITKAKLYFENALEEEPDFDRAHYELALILKDYKNLKDSIKHLKQAIEINPEYFEAFYELGVILFDLKEEDMSLKYLKKVVEITPDSEYAVKAQNFINAIEARKKY